MKPRRVSSYQSRGKEYPQIQLRGDWLRDLGYEPGREFEVEARNGELAIRPIPCSLYEDVRSSLVSEIDRTPEPIFSNYKVEVQLSRSSSAGKFKIYSPKDIARLCDPLQHRDREVFCSVHLDARHYVSGVEEVSVGTLSSSLVHPREVFKGAILSNSAGIIVAHNHPSGDLRPSEEDRKVTNRLAAAGELIGIELLDHLILAGGSYLSLKEEGLL